MLAPLDSKQWNMAKAAHLLNRAAFGGSPQEIKDFCALGFDGAVNKILNGADDSAQFPKPDWATPRNLLELRMEVRDLPEEEKKARIKEQQRGLAQHGMALINWWLNRMHDSPNPTREKLTLFWHGHFATSIQKVKDPYLMWQQNDTLRANALGNFGAMTKAIARDPAMMVYLDTNQSRRQHPNENFARELMELFTLGIGNYTEDDIQQAARAFTGYKINPANQTFRFAQFQQDTGVKKFFGKSGNFDGDNIVDMILAKPECARYIAKKVWEFLAYEDPKPAILDHLTNTFRGQNYDIKSLLSEIFRSAEFYSADAYRSQVKSPVQWLIQTTKILETGLPQPQVAINSLRQLGQVPFAPPSVKGWDGGKAWITTSTLLQRYNLANFAVGNGPINVERMRRVGNGNKGAGPSYNVENHTGLDFAKIAPDELRGNPQRLVEYICFRLFQDPLTPRETEKFVSFLEERKDKVDDGTIRDLLHVMMSTPQYQLT